MKVQALAVICTLFAAHAAFAADIPDMKGVWVGKTEPIVAGKGGPHWPESKGTFAKPALMERPMTIRITGQEGRRFWGESVVGGEGGAPGTTEPFIGTLSTNGEDVMMADTDGYFLGEVEGKTLSYCYVQAGAKKEGDSPAVATCLTVTKQ